MSRLQGVFEILTGFVDCFHNGNGCFISRVLVATPDDEPALFMQTAGINPRVGILSMLRFVTAVTC